MTTSYAAKFAGTALIFTTLLLVRGEQELACDEELTWACYSGISVRYGFVPLIGVFNKTSYLQTLCRKGQSADEFPAEPRCKDSYARCSKDEKKKFATMERGHTALCEATSDSPECKSVTLLRDCLDLQVIKYCNALPDNKKEGFKGQYEANKEAAENLKGCLKDAGKACAAEQHASALAQLEKITSAIVDLNTFSDLSSTTSSATRYSTSPTTSTPTVTITTTTTPTPTTTGRNIGSRTNEAMTVVAAVSLSWLARCYL